MSGGSSQSASAPAQSSFLNPAGGVLANLFGIGTEIDKLGGITQTGKLGEGGKDELSFANQAFGPGSFESIADLLNPNQNIGTGFAQQTLESNTASGGLFENIDQLINNEFMPALQEGLNTGFRTDIDPIRQAEERRFQQESLPQLQEQFALQTGSFGSDFLNSAVQGRADIHTELGGLQSQLDEAAAGRRAQLTGVAPQLLQGAGQVGMNLAGSGLNLGEQLILDSTAGGRQATILQMLAGLQPTSAIPRGNISSSSSKSGGA